jgi:hypothetical protein
MLLIVIVLLLGVAIGISVTYEPEPDPEERLQAVATATPGVVRIGEPINFSSEGSQGKIATYMWEFGDGNTSTEPNPTYAYGETGWYNVTLVVADKHELYTKQTINVGVQRHDIHREEQLGTDWELRPRYIKWRWDYCLLAPNIGHPTALVSCVLEGAYGTFELQLYLYWETPDGWWTGETLYSELLVAQGELDFEYTIEPEDCPEENDCEVVVELDIVIREGVYSGGTMGFDAEFPMEGLQPDW